MKSFKLLLCILLSFSLFSYNAKAGSPFTKATTLGTTGRDGAFMFAIGSDFYMGGGGGSKDFWVYHSASNTMAQLPDVPGATTRGFATAFAIGNKGYVGLGEDNGTTTSVRSDLWSYDPATQTWTREADLPGLARDGAFVFVIGNTAYIGGGSNDTDLYNDFFAYNATTNKWTQKGMLPYNGIIFPAAFTINNIGYITGGQINGLNVTNSLYQYDTTGDTWTQKADFPGAARETSIGIVIGSKVYVGLGQSQYKYVYDDFYSYDPANDKWSKINTFGGGSRAWSSAASNGSKAYFGFGWDFGSNFYNDLWSFDVSQVSGIESSKPLLSGICIYPDPAQDYLYLSTPGNIQIQSLVINDLSGRTLKTVYPDGTIDHLKIDISGLAKGVYFLNINSGQSVDCKKFVVY